MISKISSQLSVTVIYLIVSVLATYITVILYTLVVTYCFFVVFFLSNAAR